MTASGFLQIGLYVAILLALVKPLGWYMARVYEGLPCGLDRIVRPIERAIYRLCGVQPTDEMTWRTYGIAMLLFNAAGVVCLYALQRIQGVLPLNPQGFGPVAPDLAFNTAASFVTNTNWQAYAGESTMGHLTQMLGLTELRLGSNGNGDLDRADSGADPAEGRHDRKFLGRSGPQHTLYLVAACRGYLPCPRVLRRRPDLGCISDGAASPTGRV